MRDMKIEQFEVTEGQLKAVKDTSTFGGTNMWHLYVQKVTGNWDQVQWMGLYSIQQLFYTKLPIYPDPKELF
jgi:hypothetical protein